MNNEKDDFINTYGFGDCFLLAFSLASKYNLDVGFIETMPSCTPVHAFVVKNGNSIDAHGERSFQSTLKEYEYALSEYPDEDELDISIMSSEDGLNHLSFWSGESFERNDEIATLFHENYPKISLSEKIKRKPKLSI